MTTAEKRSRPADIGDSELPSCESYTCAKYKRGDHSATYKVVLQCDHTGYWCDYALTYCRQHAARHSPEFVAEELKRTGEYAEIEGKLCDTTEGMVPMINIVAMGLAALTAPPCIWCREVAEVVAAVPINGGQ